MLVSAQPIKSPTTPSSPLFTWSASLIFISGWIAHLKFIRFNLNTERIMNIILAEKLKAGSSSSTGKGKAFIRRPYTGPQLATGGLFREAPGTGGRLSNRPTLGWTLVSLIDQQEISRALREPRNYIIMLDRHQPPGGLHHYRPSISHSFYDRLNSLSAHVNTLGQEGFNQQYTGRQGNVAIGTLIKAFNQMVVKIRKSHPRCL